MSHSKIFKVALIAVISFYNLAAFGQGYPAPSVNVYPAQIKSLSPVAWVSGTIVSRNNAKVAVEVSGRLIELAELGIQVKKGDVIGKIADGMLQLNKQEHDANVESALSRLTFLDSEVKRKTSLAKRNLSAKTDLDETLSLRDAARADLLAAKARASRSNQELAFSELKAPFDGLVAQRLSNIGEYVNNGTAVIRLVETSHLEASVFSPVSAYRFLTNSNSLAVESALGKGLAKIKALIPVADSRSHLMEVRLDMSDFDWPVGLGVKAAVANGESKSVLAVPRDALVLRREGISVFKINQENKAEQISVEVGIGAGEFVQVLGDVNEGDIIVVRGAERLRAGQAVQIKENNDGLVSGK